MLFVKQKWEINYFRVLDYQTDEVIDSYVKNSVEVQKIFDKKGWITILAKVKND